MYSVVHIRLLLNKLNKTLETLVSKKLTTLGLTISQILVLRQIQDKPKTIGEISRELCLSNGTISGIVDRLERCHFVIRVRDKVDRRVIWIHQTNKLETLLKDTFKFQELNEVNLLQGVPEEDLDQFVVALQKIDQSMTEIIKEI